MNSKFLKKNLSFKFFLKISVFFVIYTYLFMNLLRDLSIIQKDYATNIFEYFNLPILKKIGMTTVSFLMINTLVDIFTYIINSITNRFDFEFSQIIEREKVKTNISILNVTNPFLYSSKTMGLRE